MNIVMQREDTFARRDVDLANRSEELRLKLVMCAPEMELMQAAMNGRQADATYIIQRYIATGMQARGHQVTFAGPYDRDQVICTSDLEKLAFAPQTWSASGWFERTRQVSWHLQRLLRVPYLSVFSNYRRYDAYLQCLPGHDLMYERNGLYNSGAAMACKRLGLPYVVYVEADQILEHDIMGKPLNGLLRWRAKRIFLTNLQAADCVICVSEQSKGHLVSNWNVPADKVVVFPNAVDVERFRPSVDARAEARSSLAIDDNPTIIFVGNFYHWHDVDTLLKAFAQVLQANPEARLVLVGDGERRQAMMQQASDLGLGEAAQFTGYVAHAEVPRLMSAADIAVVPYPKLNQDMWLSPLKLFEYMATGNAIVASAAGQVANVVQDGNNGLLVPPGDVTAMTTALNQLVSDPDLRARLGRQAREYAVQKHSWEQYLGRLERLFANVISRRPVDAL